MYSMIILAVHPRAMACVSYARMKTGRMPWYAFPDCTMLMINLLIENSGQVRVEESSRCDRKWNKATTNLEMCSA